MKSKPRRRQRIVRLLGVGLALILLLTLYGDTLLNIVGPAIETIMERRGQPVAVTDEKMMSDWKEMRERAKHQPLEGQ